MRIACTVVFLIAVLWIAPDAGATAKYTPIAWKQLVTRAANPVLIGQRKHIRWVRDVNQNFIDDLIEHKFRQRDSVDVIVELNECYTPSQIHMQLDGFGIVSYVGKLVSYALMNRLTVARLDSLASLPSVAMIEWQEPHHPTLDVATREVQARPTTTRPGLPEDPDHQGNNVGVAIVDYGIFDAHEEFVNSNASSAIVAGFDATDPADPGDGSTRPVPGTTRDHGTNVAAIVAGRGKDGRDCRSIGLGSTANCRGVAPQADLIDVKVCPDATCGEEYVLKGLEWIGTNAERWNIQVVNISLAGSSDDDGTSAECGVVDYLATRGICVVAAHGNATNAGKLAGTPLTAQPGAASFAITVAAIDDKDSEDRTDDGLYSDRLLGPRVDYPATGEPLALKPDIAAPGETVETAAYTGSPPRTDAYVKAHGTSMSSPIVAGAAAVIRGLRPDIDPASVKDLLQREADASIQSIPESSRDVVGAGTLNIYEAVQKIGSGPDVRFASCTGPASVVGQPCPLASLPWWDNSLDITTDKSPQENVDNTVYAKVLNDNTTLTATNVMVNFWYRSFAMSSDQFHFIGSYVIATLAPGGVVSASHAWKPTGSGHQCIQATIAYGVDPEFGNNVTQRNLMVAPSRYDVQVENPYFVPARIRLVAESDRKGWNCSLSDSTFTIDPERDAARTVRITFDAPPQARPGEHADAQVSAYATKSGERRETLLGGVSVRTYVPVPCRLVGQVLDTRGRPVSGASLRFTVTRSKGPHPPDWEQDRLAQTDRDGVFSMTALPDMEQRVTVTHPRVGEGRILVTPKCGVGTLRLELSRTGVRALSCRD